MCWCRRSAAVNKVVVYKELLNQLAAALEKRIGMASKNGEGIGDECFAFLKS